MAALRERASGKQPERSSQERKEVFDDLALIRPLQAGERCYQQKQFGFAERKSD
jgi:hypothetical protein